MSCKINSPDPENVPGELQVKGMNVMKGYFKNPEATDSVFKDGWMNTGDLCTMDSDGFIYIRGRNKNMILGPSGQNIYPEEIEQRLNNLPYVSESIVVEKSGKLVALIYPCLLYTSTVKIAYVDQRHHDLLPEKTVYEVISQGVETFRMGGRDMNARAYLSKFNFTGADQEKKIGVLSGGERNRLHLAMALKEEGNVLLLDEPTNDIDVNTLRALEEGLEEFAGCAVAVSYTHLLGMNISNFSSRVF